MIIRSGHEFAADSFVHVPLATDAPLDVDSARWVAALRAQSVKIQVNTHEYTSPIFVVGPNQATVRVKSLAAQQFNPPQDYPLLEEMWSAVPLPDNFQGGGGNDNPAIVYQPSTKHCWEFWVLAKTGIQILNSAGRMVDEWSAIWGGEIPNISQHPGYWAIQPDGMGLGQSAAGIAYLGVTMTIAEQRAGVINHPIGIGLPLTLAGVVRSPAQRTDGWVDPAGDPADFDMTADDYARMVANAVPEGMRFRLPASLDLNALDMDPYARMIARAVQRHGFVVVDTTGAETLAIYAENPAANYPGYDPYYGYGGIFNDTIYDYAPKDAPEEMWPTPDARLRGFPWDKLQAVSVV